MIAIGSWNLVPSSKAGVERSMFLGFVPVGIYVNSKGMKRIPRVFVIWCVRNINKMSHMTIGTLAISFYVDDLFTCFKIVCENGNKYNGHVSLCNMKQPSYAYCDISVPNINTIEIIKSSLLTAAHPRISFITPAKHSSASITRRIFPVACIMTPFCLKSDYQDDWSCPPFAIAISTFFSIFSYASLICFS